MKNIDHFLLYKKKKKTYKNDLKTTCVAGRSRDVIKSACFRMVEFSIVVGDWVGGLVGWVVSLFVFTWPVLAIVIGGVRWVSGV